jgi:hypothetical protein
MFDLAILITPSDLSSLEVPFTHEEINNIVDNIRNDKTPVPGGYNGLFKKKFLYLIKHQFYDLSSSFYHGNLDLQCPNTAFIVLIPKIKNLKCGAHFRLISLDSMAMKLLTKLLPAGLHNIKTNMDSSNKTQFKMETFRIWAQVAWMD